MPSIWEVIKPYVGNEPDEKEGQPIDDKKKSDYQAEEKNTESQPKSTATKPDKRLIELPIWKRTKGKTGDGKSKNHRR